ITPGSPDAWITALEEYGTMSLGEVMQDALTLAERGFPMHPFMYANMQEGLALFRQWPSSVAHCMPHGRLPEPGEVFVQRDLARTMRRLIAAEESARQRGRVAGLQAAREAFYRGDIAREIVAFFQEQHGLLSYDDLASFRVQVEAPVR